MLLTGRGHWVLGGSWELDGVGVKTVMHDDLRHFPCPLSLGTDSQLDVQRGWDMLPGRGSAGTQICHPSSLCAAPREKPVLVSGADCTRVPGASVPVAGPPPGPDRGWGREDCGIPRYGFCVGPGRAWRHDHAPYI